MTMYYSTICNKLSLVGMQLPEKYKENFDVSSEGRTNFPLKTSKFSLYFSGSCIHTNESLLLLALPSTLAQTVQYNLCQLKFYDLTLYP
jgi:hypothetical protein